MELIPKIFFEIFHFFRGSFYLRNILWKITKIYGFTRKKSAIKSPNIRNFFDKDREKSLFFSDISR